MMLERPTGGSTPELPIPKPVGSETDGLAATSTNAVLDDPRALQILSTEHWALLSVRALTYTDAFSRAGMFLSTLSAATVALALVAQASDFGEGLIVFALVILPFVLFIGLATFVRLGQVNNEELLAVQAMNRIRRGYFDMVPGISTYFATAGRDDAESVMKTLMFGTSSASTGRAGELLHWFVTTPGMVAVIDAMLAAVIAALVVVQLRQAMALTVAVGALVFVAVLALLAFRSAGEMLTLKGRLEVRFPTPK
jgi:hypothetical protein